ncbi:uncharacterized protein LOC111000404 isoform X1 [Pieris rapae]|uniref:uncharacterized protein LOC111000404 isoform X1 n=1 Tax=Pieris rapae TaxID=64459 RepID=UPI001E281931|nr:uncharacterized protein LOC111000404 isoform X1 [Pieris rapae]
MKTIIINEQINLRVVKYELDFSSLYKPRQMKRRRKEIKVPSFKKHFEIPSPPVVNPQKKTDVKILIEELLEELYGDRHDWSSSSAVGCSYGSTTVASVTSGQSNCGDQTDAIELSYLESLDTEELRSQVIEWQRSLQTAGARLAKYLRMRDKQRRYQKKLCAAFSVLLRHITGDTNARFGVTPGGEGPGEGGFAEWLHAMRLVARLPAGVPQHFRRRLWLTLADRHLSSRNIDWPAAERACFRGTAQPDDAELSAQILKDLHRTGCSLFCGTEGRENQAMLRRVLLAYARWNKEVGYCQGFNMMAAIILEVMEKAEPDSLKVMIYLVEAVLPEGYFADDLRGLSADMAAFRDLLRLRLPRLANHMDYLQKISDGGGVEPPLPDVFTMQWFLTLYATWLPRDALLRIWDLILLDGNEILLLTALAIWDMLQDRILSARSADEFYSCMGGGASTVWEASDALVARVVSLNSAPELPGLRNLHRYRVTPPVPPNAPTHPPIQSAMQSMTKRGLRLFYSEDEGDSSDDGNKLALATVIPRRDNRSGTGDRLTLDIGALKRQYARLRERQRQAHVILAAACARHAAVGVPTSPTSLTVNNLLLGKSAIVSSRGRRLGPPPGAVPPSRQSSSHEKTPSKGTLNETITWKEAKTRKTLDRRNSVKWKDIKKEKVEVGRKPSIDLDESGDGIIVSEIEANEMIASIRSRSSSESSSYSSHSRSSTDTSLCDENEGGSESETDLLDVDKENENMKTKPLKNEHNSNIENMSSPTKNQATPLETTNFKSINKENLSTELHESISNPIRPNKDNLNLNLSESHALLSNNKYISGNESTFLSTRTSRSGRSNFSTANFTALSPVDLSPYHHLNLQKSSFCYDFESNLRRPSTSKADLSIRPPDLIDSFTMYPNFVPDIDISDKYASDIESPIQSPESDSAIVSEDEPPIPLKVDKYFEDSPEFFGARLTDPNNENIPSRRPMKRNSRIHKKPDSLTITSDDQDEVTNETERASSLPQRHTFVCKKSVSPDKVQEIKPKDSPKVEIRIDVRNEKCVDMKSQTPVKDVVSSIQIPKLDHSPHEYVLQSGRKNSERALQIIQENSQILSRILTKQNVTNTASDVAHTQKNINKDKDSKLDLIISKSLDSPLLKESTSDSLIGGIKRKPHSELSDKNDFLRARPISIDDPFSFEMRKKLLSEEFSLKHLKSPSSECLGNQTDLYGWENKGFFAKCDFKTTLLEADDSKDAVSNNIETTRNSNSRMESLSNDKKPDYNKYSLSSDSKTFVTLSSELKDTSTYDQKYTSDDYNYPISTSSKYNDYVLSKVSDICSRTLDKEPKICETKTDSQLSDFSQKVTSSISFTYDPSMEDDSPMGAKSNSSDTLCQITSLDQISTPISPKTFPQRETLSFPKDYTIKSDTVRIESDDTCSAITSLLETDTLSSLSMPRSPSSSSYYPFPTRPALRTPKDFGVRLGLYPKEAISSPPK